MSSFKSKPKEDDPQKQAAWLRRHVEVTQKWLDLSQEYEAGKALLDVVASNELQIVSGAWFAYRTNIIGKARPGEVEHYPAAFTELQRLSSILHAAIRKELGIEGPTESSATADAEKPK